MKKKYANITIVNKWVKLFEKKYNTKVGSFKAPVTFWDYKVIKENVYQVECIEKIKSIKVEYCLGHYGAININKLEAKCYNLLLNKYGSKIHNLSLKEKLKEILTKEEFKLICKLFAN